MKICNPLMEITIASGGLVAPAYNLCSLHFMGYNFFFNFFTDFFLNFSIFCWLFFSLYICFFCMLIFFLMEKFFLSVFSSNLKFLTSIFIWRCCMLFFFLVFYEILLFFIFFNLVFLKDFYMFLFATYCGICFFFFKLTEFFLLLKKTSVTKMIVICFTFINKKINFIVVFYFLFQFFYSFKDWGAFERYCGSTSFISSLPTFFFTQLNTFFLLVFLLAYFLLRLSDYEKNVKLFAVVFFSRCIFLSIFFGFIFDAAMLVFLNVFFNYVDDEKGSLSGIIMLFQNSVRINEENLSFLMMFSLAVLFFWILILFYCKKNFDSFSAWHLLRLDVIIVIFQNAALFESKRAQSLLVMMVLCYNMKFLISLFFKLISFLIEFFLVIIDTRIDFNKEKSGSVFNGLFGLNLIDFFNIRGIIKPLNWVYIDSNKSILVAEPTTEIIVAAKLKSILGLAKTGVCLGFLGGSHAALVFLPALGGFLDIHLVIDEAFAVSAYNSVLNSTWSSFQESTVHELDSYFKAVINNLDQTPPDRVPLRKWDQLVLDRFDAASDEEVIKRRDLAREGWVYLFFYYVAGSLLWKLVWRLIFGGGGDDDGGPGGQPPGNDTFVSW